MNLMFFVYVLFVIAGFSLLYYGINAFSLPPQMKIVLVVLLGLIGLVILWNLLASSGALHVSGVHP